MQSYSDKQIRNRNRLWQDPRFFGWQLKYPKAFCVPPSETPGNHRWCQTIVQSAKDKESGAGEDLAMIFCVRGASAWTFHWSPKAIKCFAWRVNLGAARQKQTIEYNKKSWSIFNYHGRSKPKERSKLPGNHRTYYSGERNSCDSFGMPCALWGILTTYKYLFVINM